MQRTPTEVHIPVIDRSGQTADKLHRLAFRYDAEQDAYVCPQGKLLRPVAGKDSKRRVSGTVGYHARQSDCGRYPVKSDCTRGSMRVIS